MYDGRLSAVALAAAGMFLSLACLEGAVEAEQPLTLVDVDGHPVEWAGWLAANGPAAVLLWASWTPGAEATLPRLAALDAACHERDLRLVVVAVQETLEDASLALKGVRVPWLHDRHGGLLKAYRAIQVPSLFVLDAKGVVLARLEATPEAVRGWDGQ